MRWFLILPRVARRIRRDFFLHIVIMLFLLRVHREQVHVRFMWRD